jgi:hypothetical protein
MALVLVVEDEESLSDALAYLLRKEGFEVAVCQTGPDALEAFDRAADLVLLDRMLPGPPGTELCQNLREHSDVPVIMHCGRTAGPCSCGTGERIFIGRPAVAEDRVPRAPGQRGSASAAALLGRRRDQRRRHRPRLDLREQAAPSAS